jgi:hypothetical protein
MLTELRNLRRDGKSATEAWLRDGGLEVHFDDGTVFFAAGLESGGGPGTDALATWVSEEFGKPLDLCRRLYQCDHFMDERLVIPD